MLVAKHTEVILSDELKEQITKADFSRLIDLIAELLTDEWIRENTINGNDESQ